jgi:hypothetical protein
MSISLFHLILKRKGDVAEAPSITPALTALQLMLRTI